jgi:hypothetical protein
MSRHGCQLLLAAAGDTELQCSIDLRVSAERLQQHTMSAYLVNSPVQPLVECSRVRLLVMMLCS